MTRIPWNKGLKGIFKHSEKTKKIIGYYSKYRIFSPESIRKRNLAISKKLKGRPLSEEHKKKLSIIFKGRKISEEQKKKISIANSGKNHGNWKGGISHSGGYILIKKPEHPFTNCRGYIFEHRLIMEKHIGRFLSKNEFIHHINGNKIDNRIENLQVFIGHSSHRLHHLRNRIKFCTILGCNKPHRCKGFCKSHYDKFLYNKKFS